MSFPCDIPVLAHADVLFETGHVFEIAAAFAFASDAEPVAAVGGGEGEADFDGALAVVEVAEHLVVEGDPFADVGLYVGEVQVPCGGGEELGYCGGARHRWETERLWGDARDGVVVVGGGGV